MSNKTIEERYQKILKELRNIPQNKKCMNCKATVIFFFNQEIKKNLFLLY